MVCVRLTDDMSILIAIVYISVLICLSMIKESILRERLGLGKPEIKALREKAPAGYCEREPSNKPEKLWNWLWTEDGVKWIEEQVGLKPSDIVNKPDIVECTVLRSNFVNKRIIEVEYEGLTYRATCRDNTNIKPRAIVKVKFVNGNAAVTEITKKHLKSNYNG